MIVSGLVSFMLQVMNSKYLIYNDQSNWLRMIWDFSSHLNCHNIFYENDMKIKQFGEIYNKFIDTHCIEMVSKGFQQQIKKMNTSHIKLSYPLWTVIHNLDLNPIKFKQKFGIDITNNGWYHFCHKRWDRLKPKVK